MTAQNRCLVLRTLERFCKEWALRIKEFLLMSENKRLTYAENGIFLAQHPLVETAEDKTLLWVFCSARKQHIRLLVFRLLQITSFLEGT